MMAGSVSPSPNFNARDPSIPLQYILLHYTGMRSENEAVERLCDPRSEVSAHYVIAEDGRIIQLVDVASRAWHAGQSFWHGLTDLNSASIGIELVNPGHQFGYRPFPAVQIGVLKDLMHALVKQYALSPALAPLGHSDVAPSRKEDPGELFPWQQLASDGLGLWPVPEADDYAGAGSIEDSEVQELLQRLGYDCPLTGAYDRAMRAALLAFQRRYEPLNLTGTPEKETIARLRAMVRICPASQKGKARRGGSSG